MMKMHKYVCRIYAEDVDYLGIVYHANHLRFLERARTEFLREAGLSLAEMAEHGTLFAIVDVKITYHAPAKLDDELIIETDCRKSRATALEFTQTIHHASGSLLCEAVIRVVCLNSKLKPKRLPKLIDELFSAVPYG